MAEKDYLPDVKDIAQKLREQNASLDSSQANEAQSNFGRMTDFLEQSEKGIMELLKLARDECLDEVDLSMYNNIHGVLKQIRFIQVQLKEVQAKGVRK